MLSSKIMTPEMEELLKEVERLRDEANNIAKFTESNPTYWKNLGKAQAHQTVIDLIKKMKG